MNRKERKAEVERLAEELKAINAKANGGLEIYVPTYSVVRMTIWQKWICVLIITFVVTSGVHMLWGWPIGIVIVPLVAVLIVGFILILICGVGVEEVKYRKRDIDRLKRELNRAKMALGEYEQKVAELEPLIQKFRKLEPIVVEELKGEFELSTKGRISNFYVSVVLLDKSATYDATEQGYADLVRRIIVAREDRKLIREFEDSVNQ